MTAILTGNKTASMAERGPDFWFPTVGLRRVHIIAERLPMMHRHGWEGPKLDKAGLCFAWFIFERGRKPQRHVPVRWVSWKESVRRFPQTDADTPPVAKEQLGLFEGVAA